MMGERPAGGRKNDAALLAFKQRQSRKFFHLSYAPAGGGERQIRSLCATGDARGFGDMEEKPQVDQIKTHW